MKQNEVEKFQTIAIASFEIKAVNFSAKKMTFFKLFRCEK